MKIAFDIDGTLLDEHGNRRQNIVSLLVALADHNTIIVWSGGGVDYARRKILDLGLEDFVNEYRPKLKVANSDIDIAIDDQEVTLGRQNIRV